MKKNDTLVHLVPEELNRLNYYSGRLTDVIVVID